MKYILTAEQMREADEFAIGRAGIPSITLMERAGAALADEAEDMCPQGDIVVVCGGGNNGGDGFVCARVLRERGRSAAVVCIADRMTEECRVNRNKFEKAGGEVFSVFPRRRFALAVDCLFGTGFHGEPTGKSATAIDYVNSAAEKVLAADVPSGVSGTDGRAAKRAVKADRTLCIGEYKTGVFLGDGPDFAGEAVRADIGIPLPEPENYAFLTDREEVADILPPRSRNSHKGSYGRAAIVAGSERYTGAAYLAAAAALRSGCGYTCLFLPEAILPLYALKLPEVLLSPVSDGGRVAFTEKNFEKLLDADSVAIGMGTEVCEGVFEGVAYLLSRYTGRLILDADALNSLAKYGRGRLEEIFAEKKCDVLLTPHPKEFSRLADACAQEISTPAALAEALGASVLLKGAATVVSDGKRTTVSCSGSSGQAKGGSGDVLSGLIAGLCAQGMSAFDGGRAGAWLAGKAAEFAAEETGEYSMTASDEILYLSDAFLSLKE